MNAAPTPSLKNHPKSDGALCITEAAKALNQRPREFFGWLAHHQWIFKRGERDPWMAYQHRINAGLLRHKTTRVPTANGPDRAVTQVLVTPRGLDILSERLGQIPHAH